VASTIPTIEAIMKDLGINIMLSFNHSKINITSHLESNYDVLKISRIQKKKITSNNQIFL
jgi:hypothetical protein